MPQTAPEMQKQLGISGDAVVYENSDKWGMTPEGTVVEKGATLFPRIDVDKEIEELNAMIAPAKEERPKIEGLAQIGIDDFAKVELRVCEVKNCEPVKKAKKLLKVTLDDGNGERVIASGIAQWYKPEDLIGRKIVCVANLKPAVLCGIESCGMLLAANVDENTVKVLFVVCLCCVTVCVCVCVDIQQ